MSEKPTFQHYTSAKTTMRMITPKGARITFIDNSFVTSDSEVIRYLDRELKNPTLGITKGKLMTAEDADPMKALKAKIIAEHEAKKATEGTEVEVEVEDAVPVTGVYTLSTDRLKALASQSGS